MILPPEWIENNIESYIYQHTTKSHMIYWMSLFAVALALVVLPFVYVDVSIQSNGIVRPISEKTEIKAAISEVINKVYVHEGQEVKKGELLFCFRASDSQEKINYQNNRLKDFRDHIADLQKLSRGETPRVFLSATRLQEYRMFLGKKQELQVSLDQAKQEYKREKILYNKSLVSLEEYEKYQYTYQSKKEELAAFVETQLSNWQTELNTYQNQCNEMLTTQKQEKLEIKDLYEVRSPIDGTIEQLSGIYSGNSIQAGQTIASVIPNSSICVETYVSPNDIGYIFIGMPVKVQITSFNYNEWGTVKGRVVYISSDNISDASGNIFFKVKCQLERNYLTMRKIGIKGWLKKGMVANVRFIVTKRSLFDLLYQNIDEWMNPTQNKVNDKIEINDER